MKFFKDRQSAGILLSKHLKKYKIQENTIVLAIPRGGVVVAKEVANGLNLPLDIIVTRKIGAPTQKELALGAVDGDGQVVWDEAMINDSRLMIEDLKEEVEAEVEEIKRRERVYRQGRKPLNLRNKTIILTDDGIATGATTLAAIKYLKNHGAKKIILAVPVASKESIERVKGEIGEDLPAGRQVGEIIVLETPDYFQAVGQFYQDFGEVTDKEVIQYLNYG